MSALQIHLFMQNKANFQKVKFNVNKVLTRNYDQMDTWSIRKNEPKTNPKQTQFKAKTNPIQTQLKPKQTQFKPNSNPTYRGVALGEAGTCRGVASGEAGTNPISLTG
jgi:hypothetical protein